MTPSKQELLRSPRPVSTEPAMSYDQMVAAIEAGHRRDVAAGAAFAAEGRDVTSLPQVEHPGSPVGPEAQTLDAAVRAADQVLVGTVVGLVHGVPTTARVRVDVAVRGAPVGQELTVRAGGQVVLPAARDCLDDAQWLAWRNALPLLPGMRVALLLVPDDEPGQLRQLHGVGGYDLSGGRVDVPPSARSPFAREVDGLTEDALVARLRTGAGREGRSSAPRDGRPPDGGGGAAGGAADLSAGLDVTVSDDDAGAVGAAGPGGAHGDDVARARTQEQALVTGLAAP